MYTFSVSVSLFMRIFQITPVRVTYAAVSRSTVEVTTSYKDEAQNVP